MSNIKIKFQNNLKRVIAIEFIFVFFIAVSYVSIYSIGDYFQTRYEKKIENNKRILDSMPRKQFLWITLLKNNLYNGSFSEFNKDYKNTEDQILLFNLVSNNGLFTKEFGEFRVKYFKKESLIDDLFRLYYNEFRLDNEYIQNQSREFWNEIREKQKYFKILLKEDSTSELLYTKFVENGYKNSITEFKKLIFDSDSERYLSFEEVQNIEKEIKIENPDYRNKAFNIISLIFILLFPFRYLIKCLLWSFKQIKIKGNFD